MRGRAASILLPTLIITREPEPELKLGTTGKKQASQSAYTLKGPRQRHPKEHLVTMPIAQNFTKTVQLRKTERLERAAHPHLRRDPDY